MKIIIYRLSYIITIATLISCGGGKSTSNKTEETDSIKMENLAPNYIELDKPQIDLSEYKTDKDGYITIFDGKTTHGWRGYGKDSLPERWSIENGTLKLTGNNKIHESIDDNIIFAHKFNNFSLKLEWKVAEESCSGIFYLVQEIEVINKEGQANIQSIEASALEYDIADNKNEKKQTGSLHDIILAETQNPKPAGEWNKAEIRVYKGAVSHKQNEKIVLEYHLWTPQWTKALERSKFRKDKNPLAFDILNNCGGPDREGYIGLRDHGREIWFRNIKVKILDKESFY